jgi:uncharacterized membrane protein YebE (DUF533 family)
MTPEQIDVFAEGLYHLAVCDGVDETEVRFIREFLAEAGADPARIDNLGQRPFDADELEWHLNTQHLRRVFIKACYLLVKADGVVSDKEREIISLFAEVVGETEHLAELEKDAIPMPSA